MSTPPTMVVTPGPTVGGYATPTLGPTGGTPVGGGTSFANTLGGVLQGWIDTGHQAESAAAQALRGDGSLTEVVTALSQAQLSLETATAIRDRAVQAYQDILKMPI
jgi:flagellar hook-basal body complex protein FliE